LNKNDLYQVVLYAKQQAEGAKNKEYSLNYEDMRITIKVKDEKAHG